MRTRHRQCGTTEAPVLFEANIAAGMDEDPDAAISLPLGAGRLTRDAE